VAVDHLAVLHDRHVDVGAASALISLMACGIVSGYSPPRSMVLKRRPVRSRCGSCGRLSGVISAISGAGRALLSGAGVFTRADLIRLAARLSEIAGKFLLSVNDVSEMREAFTRFGIESAATRYTASGCKGIDVAEIVVTGPSPDAVLPARDLSSL
jgi:hypothetical protein